MPERVGAVEDRRRLTAQAAYGSAAGQQVADERLATRDQLVGKHVPRTRFQAAVTQECRELGGTFGPHLQIVLEQDGLAIEQEALAVCRGIIEQLVDELYQPLSESLRFVIPLAIPMRVGDDVDLERIVRHEPGQAWETMRERRRPDSNATDTRTERRAVA